MPGGGIVHNCTIRFSAVFEGEHRLLRVFRQPADLAGGFLLILYVATICAVALVFPLSNWDMIAYVASVLENNGYLGHELHGATYDLVRRSISDGEFLVLTADRPYRIAQHTDPDAFITMLGFYRVKMLYIEFAEFLTGTTDAVTALRWVSAISAAALGLLILLWLHDQRCLPYAPLAIIALMACGFGDAARYVTPDLSSSVFVVAGVLLYTQDRGLSAGIALFLAVLARPDHLALVGVFAVMSIAIRPISKGVILSFIAGLAAYISISRTGEHPGWWIQMWFTNVEYVPTLEGFDPPFSILVYLQIVVQTVVRTLVEQQWLAVLLTMVFALALMLRNDYKITRRETVALTSLLVTIPAKFIVFPLYDSRFYFAYLITLALVLIAIFGKERRAVFFSQSPAQQEEAR